MPALLLEPTEHVLYKHPLTDRLFVGVFGRQTSLNHQQGMDSALIRMQEFLPENAQSTIILIPPARDGPGYRRIVHKSVTSKSKTINADGIVVPGNDIVGVITQSRDCPVVTLANVQTGKFAVIHAARELLKPGPDRHDLVTAALSTIAPNPSDRAYVRAHISASIGGLYFRHEQNRTLTYYFFDRFGWQIYVGEPGDAALDLPKIIRLILNDLGVPADQSRRPLYLLRPTSGKPSGGKGRTELNVRCPNQLRRGKTKPLRDH